MAANSIVIGEDFQWVVHTIKNSRTLANIPSATVTWELVDLETGDVVKDGTMTEYDDDPKSVEAFIPRADTALLTVNRKYFLRWIITNNGRKTPRGVELQAVQYATC